ncbi:hypothetical protein F2P79_007322 [Pimephales promelas]|nr:hypothetical protein F2P79_007322 [Pimephales promelas]
MIIQSSRKSSNKERFNCRVTGVQCLGMLSGRTGPYPVIYSRQAQLSHGEAGDFHGSVFERFRTEGDRWAQ